MSCQIYSQIDDKQEACDLHFADQLVAHQKRK